MSEIFGEWIVQDSLPCEMAVGRPRYKCPYCLTMSYVKSKYCPECGADLRGLKVLMNIYPESEDFYNCRVQVLKDPNTGNCSWGWYRNNGVGFGSNG